MSSIFLAVVVYIHRNCPGHELIDILNTLGFSDDYKEIQRLNIVFLTKGDTDHRQQKFIQLSSKKSNRQIVNQLHQQCPYPQALHFCRTHWQLWASSLKTEDHRYLEAFTKDTNTHDKVWKPLLKSQTPKISCKGWGNILSESVWSRATTWSGQVPLNHVQQANQQIIAIYQIWVTNTAAFKQCFITVTCISLYSEWLCNEISACAWCWQDRGEVLVLAETDNPVVPDNLCNAGAKLHLAEHMYVGKQD